MVSMQIDQLEERAYRNTNNYICMHSSASGINEKDTNNWAIHNRFRLDSWWALKYWNCGPGLDFGYTKSISKIIALLDLAWPAWPIKLNAGRKELIVTSSLASFWCSIANSNDNRFQWGYINRGFTCVSTSVSWPIPSSMRSVKAVIWVSLDLASSSMHPCRLIDDSTWRFSISCCSASGNSSSFVSSALCSKANVLAVSLTISRFTVSKVWRFVCCIS